MTIGIGGVGTLPQAGNHAVTFVRIQQILRKLCRFPEADGQHARRQRVQRAGMSGTVGVIDAFYFLQDVIAGHALRLIQQQDAVNVATTTTRTTH